MDIYRFFHPHHNPRLYRTGLRLQELNELEHAASELRKAIERAQQITDRQPCPPILTEHFTDLIKAMRYVETSLQTLMEAHPGDSMNERTALISERESMTGWENWTRTHEESIVREENKLKQL